MINFNKFRNKKNEMLSNLEQGTLELMNNRNTVSPNYPLDVEAYTIEIYISHSGDLYIIKRIDGNYIAGASTSSIKDRERTQKIIEEMVENNSPLISQEFRVFGTKLRDPHYVLRFEKLNENQAIWWETTEYISSNLNYKFGTEYFSQSITNIFFELKKISEARLKDNKYTDVLKTYQKLLSKYKRNDSEAKYYYEEMKPVIEIMRREKYLLLSEDSKIRSIYSSIIESGDDLYSSWMDAYR